MKSAQSWLAASTATAQAPDFIVVSVWLVTLKETNIYSIQCSFPAFNLEDNWVLSNCVFVFTDHDWCGREPRRGAESRVLLSAMGSGGSLSLLLFQGNLAFLNMFCLLFLKPCCLCGSSTLAQLYLFPQLLNWLSYNATPRPNLGLSHKALIPEISLTLLMPLLGCLRAHSH